MKLLSATVISGVLTLAAAQAGAALIVYTNQAAWESAVGGSISLEDFNGVAVQTLPVGTTTLGQVSATLNDGVFPTGGPCYPGRESAIVASGAIDGSHALSSYPSEPCALVLGLPGAATAFAGDFFSTLTGNFLSFTIAGDTVLSPINTGFIGFISSSQFTSVLMTSPAEQFQTDNIRFNSAVPEPNSFAVLVMAALGAFALRRLRLS